MRPKKYELTDESKEVFEHILYRIKALKDFSNVKKGDLRKVGLRKKII